MKNASWFGARLSSGDWFRVLLPLAVVATALVTPHYLLRRDKSRTAALPASRPAAAPAALLSPPIAGPVPADAAAPAEPAPAPAQAAPVKAGNARRLGTAASIERKAGSTGGQAEYLGHAARERARYRVRPAAPGAGALYCASNPNGRFTASFGREGLELRPAPGAGGTWKLKLTAGKRGQPGKAEFRTERDRVEIRRGGLVEYYANRPHGLEAGVILVKAPDAPGKVKVKLVIDGDLAPILGRRRREVRLLDDDGRVRAYYRDFGARDADGRALGTGVSVEGGRAVLAVDAGEARFPVTVGGLIVPAAPAKTNQDRVTEITNQERWDNGALAPLKRESTDLDVSAEYHCEDMILGGFFSHTSLNGSGIGGLHFDAGEDPWDRMAAVGYAWNAAGENIAGGYSSPASVMDAWMNSAGHRANILSTSYRELGVGYVYNAGSAFWYYWTQNFGRRNVVYPVVINREAHEATLMNVSLYVYGAGWAAEMRFSNDAANWSQWETYGESKTWPLSFGDGLKTVYCEIKDGGGTVRQATDSIWLSGSTNGDPVVSDFSPATPLAVASGATQQFTVDGWDPDGDALSYTWRLNGELLPEVTDTLDLTPDDSHAGGNVLEVTVSDGNGGSATHSWDITVSTAGAAIAVSTVNLAPGCTAGQNAAEGSFTVWNSGPAGTVNYTITETADWLSLAPASGDSTGEQDTITVTYATSGLAVGTHSTTITVTDAAVANSPRTIDVTLTVGPKPKKSDGGGGGCALATSPAGAGGAPAWLLPCLAMAGLWLLGRRRRRNGH